MRKLTMLLFGAACGLFANGEIVGVGSGSYTTTFPGYDAAGRNSYPTSSPLVSGNAATRPVPSNDWWSSKLTNAFPNNTFNYPMGIKVMANGLGMVRCIEGQALPGDNPLTIGLDGLSDSQPTVCDHSDWTVTFAWNGGSSHLEAICGIGMPFVYFTRTGSADVTVSALGTVSVDGNIAVVTGSYNGASYALYAPTGSTWTRSGNSLRSNLGGKNYFSAVMLPDNAGDATAAAKRMAKYAFAFPKDTRAQWSYDQASGTVTTTYTIDVDAKEAGATALHGLLPHHYKNSSDAALTGDEYRSVRGKMKMAEGPQFTTQLAFRGILPTLPAVGDNGYGFSNDELKSLINKVINDNGLSDWTDSYNDGQLFNRMVQTARIAREAGMTAEYESLRNTIRGHLERWLTAEPGEVAFLFYYYQPWGALLGYPAGHGQDSNLNDHHFHWGYLIHAAAFLAQDDPQWAGKWGPMVELLIRDAASIDRNDPLFPHQRAFSPYAGHCWANGTATSGPGNDQESSSESMQFHSALILWGEATGNTAIRDLGIYMYATEQSAIEQYWFDVDEENFSPSYNYMIASRVFTNGYDIQNFWGGGIQGSYGIELYPIHAGSLYLMEHPQWADKFRQAIERDTPLLQNNNDPNTWHDVYWQYIAMMNAPYALQLYAAHPDRQLKFGISPAQTYHWLHAFALLGRPARTVTADYPIAAAFDLGDTRTYVVHNYGEARTVKFSDGFSMTAAARSLTTAKCESPEPWEPGEVPDVPGPGDPNNPDNPNPDDPDKPGNNGPCSITDTEASEGTFVDSYTVTFATVGNRVDVTVHFEGSYVGPVAYIFNETSGFYEINMSDQGNQTFTGSITGVTDGQVLRLRIKLAFAGGLAVTRYMTYTVGTSCDDPGDSGIADAMVEASDVHYYNMQGIEIPAPVAGQRSFVIRRCGHSVQKIFVP